MELNVKVSTKLAKSVKVIDLAGFFGTGPLLTVSQ